MKKSIYLPEDGLQIVRHLREQINVESKLIGSLGKGKTSTKDIDILLIGCSNTPEFKEYLLALFKPTSVVDTDWGGWYFHGTAFGDIDFFFTDEDFDY
jgi:hypothetical protein